MDHLPLPDGIIEHISVPYLNGIAYDNEGFLDYDTRQGWDVQRLRQGNVRGARSDWTSYSEMVLTSYGDANSVADSNLTELLVGPFIQNWILYGVFQTALKRPIRQEEGWQERIGSKGARTKCLASGALFQEFASRRRELAPDKDWATALSNCLKKCAWILEDLDTLSDELGAFAIPGPTHVALSSLVQTIDEYNAIWFQPGIPQMTASISRARWLEKDLADRGWCPHRTSRLNAEVGVSGLYYASILPKSGSERDHPNCTESVCLAYNISDNALYQQHHQASLCACDVSNCLHNDSSCHCKASADEDDLRERVCELVLQDEVPLISIDSSGQKIRWNITPLRDGMRYVAISHVWSDGLGNPSKNMVPSCQAEYLQSCASNVLGPHQQPGESVYLWLDTLCVPLRPDSARWAAITVMHKIFSNATVVLVLTEELMTCTLPSSTDETLMRIIQCKWMTRLWTMQEGILARELTFQFRDQALCYANLVKMHRKAFRGTTEVSHMPASKAYLAISSKIRFERKADRPADRLSAFWFSIRHRSTSRKSDQAICAGILCGLDLSRILTAPQEEKMVVLWRECKHLPLSVLWTNGPRMQIDTMRWAPESLLDPRTWAVPPESVPSVATVSPEGLCFSGVEGLAFPGLKRPSTDDSLIRFKAPSQMDSCHILLAKNAGNPSWDEVADRWTNVVLLWDKESIHEFFPGVLVSVLCGDQDYVSMIENNGLGVREDQSINARWIAQVTVLSEGGQWHNMVSHFPTRLSKDGSPIGNQLDVEAHSAEVHIISEERHWCIS